MKKDNSFYLELNEKVRNKEINQNQAAKVAGIRPTKLKEIWKSLDFEMNRPGRPIIIPTDDEIEEVINYKKKIQCWLSPMF